MSDFGLTIASAFITGIFFGWLLLGLGGLAFASWQARRVSRNAIARAYVRHRGSP